MSNLVEEAAKPILIPMIAGRAGQLSSPMQRTLATWAAKTAMTGEQIAKDNGVIRQDQRTWLKDHLEPPSDWVIWVAPYSGSQWRNLGLFMHAGKLETTVNDGAPVEHSLGLTFIGMGHLLFLVFHTNWKGFWGRLLTGVRHVERIWPLTGGTIEWPAPYTFTDFETEYFSTYMSRILDQRV